jgi:hypothetical protein
VNRSFGPVSAQCRNRGDCPLHRSSFNTRRIKVDLHYVSLASDPNIRRIPCITSGANRPAQTRVTSPAGSARPLLVGLARLAGAPESWQKIGPVHGRAKVRFCQSARKLPVPAPVPTPPRSMVPIVPIVPVVVRPPPASKRATNPSRLLDFTDLVSRFRQTSRHGVGHRVGSGGEGQDRSCQGRHH